MPFNFKQFCQDYRIPTAPKGHKHNRRGWLNISCPVHSGSKGGFHLGFNLEKSYFYCYGCGSRKIEEIVQAILGKSKAKEVIKQYIVKGSDRPETRKIIRSQSLIMPEPMTKLQSIHKRYLEKRNFNPDLLEHRYQLQGTDHYSVLQLGNDRIDYHHRIIAPIDYNHQTVSFQGRDITNRQNAKYKACPDIGEVIPHKQILYGWDLAKENSCIVVEGITGSWRLGPGSLATFGAEYTFGQIELLISRFNTIHLFMDGDEAGKIATDNMYWDLSVASKDVIVWELDNDSVDSGNISQQFADELMKEILD